MKKYKAQDLLEWENRPLSSDEAADLFNHLNTLYEAIRELELLFGQVEHRRECIKRILEE